MCTVPLPPGVNPIAVDIYININIDQMSRWATTHRREQRVAYELRVGRVCSVKWSRNGVTVRYELHFGILRS